MGSNKQETQVGGATQGRAEANAHKTACEGPSYATRRPVARGSIDDNGTGPGSDHPAGAGRSCVPRVSQMPIAIEYTCMQSLRNSGV